MALPISRLTDRVLGLISLAAGAVVSVVGGGAVILGLSGFVFGMHGGMVDAGLITIFGSALLFIGVFAGRVGYRSLRNRSEGT